MDDESFVEQALREPVAPPRREDFETFTPSPSGILTRLLYDETEERVVVHRRQDVEPILERNKALYNDDAKGWSPTREWRYVAHIPNIVVEQWMKEGINVYDPNDEKKVIERLNDPAWRYLRTAPGRI